MGIMHHMSIIDDANGSTFIETKLTRKIEAIHERKRHYD